MEFTVTGAGQLEAVDNGDPADVSPVQANRRKAFGGRALVIVRPGRERGAVILRAGSEGLTGAETRVAVE